MRRMPFKRPSWFWRARRAQAAGKRLSQAGYMSHLLEGRAGVEVLLDVLDDGAESCSGERAVPPARGLAGRRNVPDQVNGQDVGQ